jgi:8-oxo-dGTP diphosphatase
VPERPAHPVVGVGAVVVRAGKVLLIKRGKAPLQGRWVIPGGRVELGETLEDAVIREVREETGLSVRPRGVVLVFDHIDRVADRVSYHYVIVDYLCEDAGGDPVAGSDAEAAVFVRPDELEAYDVPPLARDLIRRVFEGLRDGLDPGRMLK